MYTKLAKYLISTLIIALTKLARQKGCSVAALSDNEKNQFIHGSTMEEVREKSIKL